jgi:hypothetical protein
VGAIVLSRFRQHAGADPLTGTERWLKETTRTVALDERTVALHRRRVDGRTVAGRRGHRSSGATILEIYAVWVDAAGRRAADTMGRHHAAPDRRRAAADELAATHTFLSEPFAAQLPCSRRRVRSTSRVAAGRL